MRRPARIGLTLLLTGIALAYLVWKVNLGTTIDILLDANLAWFALAVVIMVGTVPLMAVRWRWLLRAQGIDDRLTWLTRTYFTSYTAGQVLPTASRKPIAPSERVATPPSARSRRTIAVMSPVRP